MWLLRIRERSDVPALSTPQLRMIRLDLTQRGLQEKWGTWGIEQIGQHLSNAAREHRLTEALEVLQLRSTPIRAMSLSPKLLAQTLSASLDAGARVISDAGEREGQPMWSLIEITGRTPVTFADVKSEIASQVELEMSDINAVRRLLRETWGALRVELSLAREVIDLSAAQSVGFTREIKL